MQHMTGEEDIRGIIEAAEAFEAPAESLQEAVSRLAALNPLEYDQIREAEAERLRVRVGTLDDEVKTSRKQTRSEDCVTGNFLADPEPWPDPVNIGKLLDHMTELAKAYLVLPSGAAEALALWVVHAHAHDCFAISPVLG